MILVPPTNKTARSLPPLIPRTYLKCRNYRNVLLNCSMPPSKVLPHRPQPCHLQSRSNWHPFPLVVVTPSRCQSRKSPSHPMVENLHHRHHWVCHNPALIPIKQQSLNYHILHHCMCFIVGPVCLGNFVTITQFFYAFLRLAYNSSQSMLL